MTRYALLPLALLLAGCDSKDTKQTTPVVGWASDVQLYEDPKLSKPAAKAAAGGPVTVVAAEDKAWQVRTADGREGWLRPYYVCSAAEYERRKAQNLFPKKVICLGSENGKTFMYDGSMSIRDGQMAMLPGDGYWMDPTMQGKEFGFADETVAGDPAVLLLAPEKGKMVRLPLWQRPAK